MFDSGKNRDNCSVVVSGGSDVLSARAERQKDYLEAIQRLFADIFVVKLPLVSCEIGGLSNLRSMANLMLR
jgi:anion-transporting  ArsA/GET3 family ATPase